MKRLTTLTLIAVAAAAMIAVPLGAQTRGGSNSRGGSGGGNARSSGGGRPSSSISAPSSQTRSSSQSGNTKGLGSVSRSNQNSSVQQSRPSTGSSQPARGGSQASRSGSNTRSSSSGSAATRQTAPTVGSGNTSGSNNGGAVRQQRNDPPAVSSGSNDRTRQSAGQPARGGSNVDSRNTTGGAVVREARPRTETQPRQEVQSRQEQPQNRQDPGQPGGSINRNQPQPGMSADPDAPRTVRRKEEPPRNVEGGREPREIRMKPGPGRDIERIPPRHRDPMPFGRAVRFWDGGHHYFGYRVSYLPSRYTRVVYYGIPYYLLDGIYYRRYGTYYYVSRPPFGVIFDTVLDNLIYSVCNFAYYYDVYNTYRTINENAQTIASQNATIAANNATIAKQNADIALNAERAAKSYKEADKLGLVQSYADAGVEYYYEDGVFFIKDKNGKYVTIVPPAGALVQELPDDYDTVTLNGDEYYKVDDTVYKITIIDGSPYFEVLGQLTGDLAEKYNTYNVI